MSDYGQLVRVRIGDQETTVTAGYADHYGLQPLPKPARSPYGRGEALPDKQVVTLSGDPKAKEA